MFIGVLFDENDDDQRFQTHYSNILFDHFFDKVNCRRAINFIRDCFGSHELE